MKTMREFVADSHLSPALIRRVVKQIGGWEDFKEMAEEVVNHGATAGWSGFIYYSDTTAFAKRNKQFIRRLAEEQAGEFGMGTLEMVAGFNCLHGATVDEIGKVLFGRDGDTTILNALAWYALEEVCRSYVDLVEAE